MYHIICYDRRNIQSKGDYTSYQNEHKILAKINDGDSR